MAAELLIFGFEVVAAATAALLIVFLLREPVRALFGARAAYCLWLAVPAMVLAVALPRPAAPEAAPAGQAPADAASPKAETVGAAAAALPSTSPPPRVLSLPDPSDFAVPLLVLWVLGAAGVAAGLTRGQHRFLRSLGPLRAEHRDGGEVFYVARPDIGPALVGAIAPRVVLPVDFTERFTPQEQAMVVEHERAHLAGGDAQINLLVAAFRALFWFHPLVHVGARMFRVDQELACDETVVARHPGARRIYAEAMLKTQFGGSPVPLGCHWMSGGKAVLRRRIMRLALTPPRARRVLGAALAGALAVAGGAVAWAAQPAAATPPAPVSASTRQLIAAIQDGGNSRASELIEAGADVNGRVLGEGSPLILAARHGQLALAQRLLDHGADPDLVAPGEGSALIVAADAGDLAMVRLLLERRADPGLAVQGDGNPLIAAAGGGHVEVIDLLLASGARVDAVVPSDETALITAARHGHLAAVQRLVEAGADVNLAVMASRRAPLALELRSPLGMARRAGRADIVEYLIARGARA